ncbi:CGH_3_collapsed_G0034170.mRNA.1.CDS.1 [Saccharomyces cerevisiae]|nr:CGH_3_collapsed_G0034170.mRNA.1.CDS.1 [Saccharomyces cerevisiae]
MIVDVISYEITCRNCYLETGKELSRFVHFVSIFRYIIYLVDTDALSAFISDYWKSDAVMDERYSRIHRIVGLKWGMGRDRSFSFTSKLNNPQFLGSLDLEILEELEKLISDKNFPETSLKMLTNLYRVKLTS